ncbi:MAG: DUF3842 family protein [Syntrophomonadaceae bacterium]|nr:DUF3842 family protein [Syntrophomonadaceae bacterium]MDH7497969.1 DUF3842 family protein [Syntrophomonadaceae bacterium]
MRIAVVDGQGGGIGRLVVERLRAEFGDQVSILGLGTNAVAASVMLKAGANEAASGENAVVFCAPAVDVVAGSVAVLAANAFCGELTPRMAEALASSPAAKVLLPLNRCGIRVVGVVDEPLPLQVESLVQEVRGLYEERLRRRQP